MLRKAKARFKAELRRFDEEHLSEQQYLTISKNLHSFRRIEVAASIEIGNLNGSIAETAEHLDKDEAEASRLEGKLWKHSNNLCVFTGGGQFSLGEQHSFCSIVYWWLAAG